MEPEILSMKKRIIVLAIFLFSIIVLFALSLQYSRSWENALFVNPLHELHTNEKILALTFDDGPHPYNTTALLDVLDEHQVPATFFMLGSRIEEFPEIAADALSRGHLIGNHSYSHLKLIFKRPSLVRSEIEETDRLILDLGQESVDYFRPPYSGKYIVLPLILLEMNKVLVTGTYDPPSEYDTPFIAENVASDVIENVRPGSIIYLHDGIDVPADEFTRAVEIIITELRSRDYDFVRLDYQR